ncbi:MAG: hypothetical protein JST54_16255 [Deltaproteobacteria bacterium]|nr:hypothetical protein [Deltaproteobacteria bacterium]
MRILMAAMLVMAVSGEARADGGMYEITIEKVSVQKLADDGSAVGDPKTIKFTERGTTGCRLDPSPKRHSYAPFFRGTITEANRLVVDGSPKQGGAPDDIATCARSVLINAPIMTDPGKYEVTAHVSLKKLKM